MALCRFTFEADGVTIVGEGVVEIQGAPPADPVGVIVGFLDQVDPAALEQEALNRMGWGDDTMTGKILELLRALATGEVAKL